ncbi:hypothetical protein B0H12DRAFT_1156521, partial [Mycena haematopus]
SSVLHVAALRNCSCCPLGCRSGRHDSPQNAFRTSLLLLKLRHRDSLPSTMREQFSRVRVFGRTRRDAAECVLVPSRARGSAAFAVVLFVGFTFDPRVKQRVGAAFGSARHLGWCGGSGRKYLRNDGDHMCHALLHL